MPWWVAPICTVVVSHMYQERELGKENVYLGMVVKTSSTENGIEGSHLGACQQELLQLALGLRTRSEHLGVLKL